MYGNTDRRNLTPTLPNPKTPPLVALYALYALQCCAAILRYASIKGYHAHPYPNTPVSSNHYSMLHRLHRDVHPS